MSILLVGFDSAWMPGGSGGVVGALMRDDKTVQEIGAPEWATFDEATERINGWSGEFNPSSTLIFLDQPIVVPNATGKRPVERMVSSPIGRRRGGVQPANTGNARMFGTGAPVDLFLKEFGGTSDPRGPLHGVHVLETYPALTLVALGWDRDKPPGSNPGLPKYNPGKPRKFAPGDWSHVCTKTATALRELGTPALARFLEELSAPKRRTKQDQDLLDSCLCLLVALRLARGDEGLLVGDTDNGYMLTVYGQVLQDELEQYLARKNVGPIERIFLDVRPTATPS